MNYLSFLLLWSFHPCRIIFYDHLEKLDKEIKSKKEEKIHEAEEKKKKRKGAPVEEQQGWVDISDKVHAVYVSNLPLDITEEEFTVCFNFYCTFCLSFLLFLFVGLKTIGYVYSFL